MAQKRFFLIHETVKSRKDRRCCDIRKMLCGWKLKTSFLISPNFSSGLKHFTILNLIFFRTTLLHFLCVCACVLFCFPFFLRFAFASFGSFCYSFVRFHSSNKRERERHRNDTLVGVVLFRLLRECFGCLFSSSSLQFHFICFIRNNEYGYSPARTNSIHFSSGKVDSEI